MALKTKIGDSNTDFSEYLNLKNLEEVMVKIREWALLRKSRTTPKTALENLHQSMFKKTRKEK